ncbi:DUF1846 domain-containing protein [Histomonas meleagridis]|uniref:DUF1846 domain-containing protein n=1 Tax=Histomonas meleagridis TaxID=135588 RepID=UPI0035596135|nr:DUF1846 domain-containing protein [Histomonas meleagridis]KAH0801288.1 DUF1846 domain-containing protein [Histomonas meleagridis]
MKIGFDSAKYLDAQKEKIIQRLKKSGDKLYIEFGGKLLFDYHASRVLPGYDPNNKIKLLQELSTEIDIILCVNASDIERHKLRADFGISYDLDVLKIIDDLKSFSLPVTTVVITQYKNQRSATSFKNKLENMGIQVCCHPFIQGYPTDIENIVSEKGFGSCQYIETTKKIVVVTAPGPGSGKLATCLSQLYHESMRGIKAGYAKFETFPIWNMPLDHPVNVAYEAATLDLEDYNLIDPFHEEAYHISSVNYNRDVEAFPVLRSIFEKITKSECIYKSPTDMGINCISEGIISDEVIREASKQEIICRHLRCIADFAEGITTKSSVMKSQSLLQKVGASIEDRVVVAAARKAAETSKTIPGKGNHGIFCGAAIQLKDGTVIKGYNSPELHSASAVLINAGKKLSGIPDEMHLLAPGILQSIGNMKENIYNTTSASLDVNELLIVLGVSSIMNPAVVSVLESFKKLAGCEMHLTHIPTEGDTSGIRKLGIRVTYDPNRSTNKLFINHN